MELRDDGMCFACGKNNPIGLKLEFEFDDEKSVAMFTPKREHQGYDNITHGGIISTLLDEAMAKLVCERGYLAVTGELQVRFRKPAIIGEELTIIGRITSKAHRIIYCAAEIRNKNDELVAEATGRMVEIR